MPFRWSEYLDLADWLSISAGNRTTPAALEEAVLRSAISRAYYASFHASKALVVSRGEYQSTGLGTEHGEVIRVYQAHNAQPRKQIGTWLLRLRDRRRRADYDDAVVTTSVMAGAALADAHRILVHLAAQ